MCLYVREACKYTDKGNKVAKYINNIYIILHGISCVFNGFKYICSVGRSVALSHGAIGWSAV